ncbi:MAG: F0F1 ATP synthase subunit delta [Alphaproteobacteria bacterium]|nr:F0F1 ATP synthase subunit delta [Alphaproteobacteria bacterium]MCD8571152.1 F0F1 ATP synthase subunit delta [Alphaproteobacteria bacterium]
MSASRETSQIVALRYAKALIDLAEESKSLKNVESDLAALEDMLEESADLRAMIASPVISRGNQQAVMTEISKKAGFDKTTLNFLKTLAENRRLYALKKMIDAVRLDLSKRRGEMKAIVKVAQDLTDAQRKELEAALTKSAGVDVSVEVKVEPSILGGMIVTMGSHMIDDSVARKLEKLRITMESGANENASVQELKPAAKGKK